MLREEHRAETESLHEQLRALDAELDELWQQSAPDRSTVLATVDEIGELPLDIQPKLLRVLERREVQQLGSDDRKRVDVRVVSATHRDLARMVEEGTFRRDLYYRISGMVLSVPSLRERPDDVVALAVARALGVFGPERILFGTDSNVFPAGWRSERLVEQRAILEELEQGTIEQEMIFGGNARRLLGKA